MKNAEKDYVLRVPYPHPARPERPAGPRTLQRLHAAAAGRTGIMTALCRYLRSAAVCRARGEEELAGLFDAAAQTACVHLGLVAGMLAACGGDPGLFVPRSGHKIWWSAGWASGGGETGHPAERALAGTLAACAEWRALARELPDCLRPCAERILADEQHYADLFRRAAPDRGIRKV